MPSNQDQVHDAATGGRELHRLTRLYDLPAFVKQSDTNVDLFLPPGQVSGLCADPQNNQFPCHTKAATYWSHLFFLEKQAEFHPKDRVKIAERLAQFADQYPSIKPALESIRKRHAELYKDAEAQLPDSSFAYVWIDDASGDKTRQLPIRSTEEVKAAAEYLEKYRDAFPFTDRQKIAARILEKAAAYGAGIGEQMPFLERQVGRGVCEPDEVVREIEKRAELIPAKLGVTYDHEQKPQGGLRNQFLKMAEAVKEAPRIALQPQMLLKLAETLDNLDRDLDLRGRYGRGLTRPEDVIFKETFAKLASDVHQHVATTTGTMYEKKAFGKLPLADLEALFGTEFSSRVDNGLGDVDVEKMAEEVGTLPRPDAQLLDTLLSDNGIAPIMRKAAASRTGLPAEQMERLAAMYAG